MKAFLSALCLLAAMAVASAARAECDFELDSSNYGYCTVNVYITIDTTSPNDCWVEIIASTTSFSSNCDIVGKSWCQTENVCDAYPDHVGTGGITESLTLYHWCSCTYFTGETSEVRIWYKEDNNPYGNCACAPDSMSCSNYAWRGLFYCAPA